MQTISKYNEDCGQGVGRFWKSSKVSSNFRYQFLLRYSKLTDNKEALQQALLSLDKMMRGRHLRSIRWWLCPILLPIQNGWLRILKKCFMTMLCSSARFQRSISTDENWTIQGSNRRDIGFIETTLMHKDGGFFSALDADSEGEEGKFYVWNFDEIKNLLGDGCCYFLSIL